MSRTWASVISAVTLTFTPLLASRFTRATALSPLVLEIGILT